MFKRNASLLAAVFALCTATIDAHNCPTTKACKNITTETLHVTENAQFDGNTQFNGNAVITGDLQVDGDFNKAQQIASVLQDMREARAHSNVPDAISWTHGVAYQIQQQGFWNASNNPKAFGNIKGITSRLDYLADLGIEAIWVTQPTLGASWWGFNQIDPKLITPNTGTNYDMQELIKAAHAKGIKVIMGSVWHQTSTQHPFFQKALTGDPEAMDRYYFVSVPENEPMPLQAFNVFFSDLWVKVKNVAPNSALAQRPEDWYFRSKFGSDVADTNLTNPLMIDWIVDFSRFWINKGIDGFRIDASSITEISGYRDGEFVNGMDPNDQLNQTIIRRLRQIKPDLFLFAEAFEPGLNPDGSINNILAGRTFDDGRLFGSAGNFQLFSLLYNLLDNNNGELFIDQYMTNVLPQTSSYTDVTFAENHDVSRFISSITIGNTQPVPSLDAPPSYAPAPDGAFRIHYDKASLPPALLDDNMNLYYFSAAGASNPFPGGSVNNLDVPPGNTNFPFLGGGDDDFGPYWDFPLSHFADFGGDNQFGFIVIQKSSLSKISGDIDIKSDIANVIIANGKGDIFVRGLPVPTTFPTEDQLNHVQTFYGLLLSLPGSPMLWQGQEQGMQSSVGGGISDSTREAVVWSEDGSQVKGFSPYVSNGLAPAGYENIFSTAFTVRPPDASNPLWVYMRDAIRARKGSPALKQGEMKLLPLPGNRDTDVVTIFDEGQDIVTSEDVVAFTRSLNNWPVVCIFNFGETPKQVEVRPGKLLSCGISFQSAGASLNPQLYFSHNISMSASGSACEPVIITMPQYSSAVFVPIQFFGTPNGSSYQNLPGCCF